jgi:predicted lipoprotein with Yx(FWY)xxD motif
MDEIVTDNDGTRRWYRDGLLHREDGPALELPDGTRRWYRNGQLHREDGPAVERHDGTREWWVDGKRIKRKPKELK